jgi:hypothetical protein
VRPRRFAQDLLASASPTPLWQLAPQVLFVTGNLVEKELIGAIPVRNTDLTMTSSVLANPQVSGEKVLAYDARNPRHTNKELVRYALATKRAMEAPRIFS